MALPVFKPNYNILIILLVHCFCASILFNLCQNRSGALPNLHCENTAVKNEKHTAISIRNSFDELVLLR